MTLSDGKDLIASTVSSSMRVNKLSWRYLQIRPTSNVVIPANMRRWPNVDLLLGHRRRRWANSKPALGQRLVFVGMAPYALIAAVSLAIRIHLKLTLLEVITKLPRLQIRPAIIYVKIFNYSKSILPYKSKKGNIFLLYK